MPISGMCCLSGRARNRSAERYRKGTETLVRGVREYIRRGFRIQFFSLSFSLFILSRLFFLVFLCLAHPIYPTSQGSGRRMVRYGTIRRNGWMVRKYPDRKKEQRSSSNSSSITKGREEVHKNDMRYKGGVQLGCRRLCHRRLVKSP